tara:strand:- start:3605 stop:3958 length:354 start_codon:yes stop_codon:yes gene_type:complete
MKKLSSDILIISLSTLFFLVIGIPLITSKNKRNSLNELVKTSHWQILFAISFIWSIYILVFKGKGIINDKETLDKYIDSTKKAILAFIIAIFAYLDITIAVYWVIWIMSYFLSGWVS